MPLDLGVPGQPSEQSSKTVQLMGLGWGSESTASLLGFIPGLAESIMKLQTDGLRVLTPDGMRALKMDFHIGADLSSIWKSTGIGSAMAEETCLYCLISKLERQIPGNAKCDLSNKDMWRRGADGKLLSIFGLESIPKIHLCSLHGLTRISEKLMKLLAVATVF